MSAVENGVPDPRDAASIAEFVGMLRLLKSWAGDPSFRDLAKDASYLIGGGRRAVSHTTVADVFRNERRRLDLDLVVAIVRALGLDEEQARRWRDACVSVHAAAKNGGATTVRRQLPADLPTFIGRREVLEELVGAATAQTAKPTTIVISAIEGMAGIGKTRLAIHAGHALVRAGRCPDAQFYVNLRGFDSEHEPSEPGEVLEDFLRQLGVSAAHIPIGVAARSAMFRDRMHGKRALLILDNAASEAQVADLLPASPGCVVLITSRRSLSGLDGARMCQLDVLSQEDALALLARVAGPDRVDADPAAARAVVEFCGRLPLALALAAGRLRSRPAWDANDLLDHLRASRLDSLALGGREIRSVFELSYRGLPPAGQRLFRMAALHPGPDVSIPAAASLAGSTVAEARTVLGLIQDEHLLQERTPRRYEFHDLVRAFARDTAESTETVAECRAAIDRVAGWYLHSACSARTAMDPHLPPMNPVASSGAVPPLVFADRADALGWFEAERANLVAVGDAAGELGLLEIAWQLPTAMFAFFDTRMYYGDWIRTHHTAADAAARLGDKEAQGRVVCNLGSAFREQRRLDAATEQYLRALDLFREVGYLQGEAKVLGNLGSTYEQLGKLGASVRYQRRAIDLFRALGDPYGQALSLTNLGSALARAGRFETASQSHRAAIELFDTVADVRGRALALGGLGTAVAKLGRLDEGLELLVQSAAMHERLGDLHSMALARMSIAEACVSRGDRKEARRQLVLAAAVYREERDDQRLAEVTGRLARIT